MTHNFEPIIVLKTYDFYLGFYLEIKKWPKPDRYHLGERCENIIFTIFENLLIASRARYKQNSLFNANIKLQILKNLLRIAKDIKILSDKKYLFFQNQLFEIGNMLGGWLKSI